MCNRLTIYFLAIGLFLFGPELASLAYGQTPILGPEVYTRGPGKPQKIVKSFSIEGHVPYALYVQNGDGKKGKVSSAVVEVNGIKILWPEDFDKQVDVLIAPVKLKEQNEIAVEVRSEPGTYVIVKILASTTPEILASVCPDHINVNGDTTVTISALMELKSNLTPSSVILTQYNETYKSATNLGSLYDDGTHGDLKAGDNQFRTQIVINESSPTRLHYRVSADYKYKEILKRVKSDFFSINVAKIPSVTETITPQGGTITIEGYASVTFPAGAFAASQSVTVSVTSSPETQEDYLESGEIFKAGPRLPYEIRIDSGFVEPVTSFNMVLFVPDSFIATLPSNAKIRIFVQIYQDGGEEVLDHFEIFPSTFNHATKTIQVTLSGNVFTNLRHIEDTYEAIVIVGTTFK